MTQKNNFGLGMLLGTVVGGIAALLLAPGSGKQTRQKAVKKVKSILKYLEEQKLDQKIKELVEDPKTLSSKYFTDIKKGLVKELNNLSSNIEKIDFEAYSKKVDTLIEKAKKEYKKVPSAIDGIRNHFLSMFDERAEDVIEEIEKEVASSLKVSKKEEKKVDTRVEG